MARIVVADEDREVRELILFSLKFAGHTVYGASNTEEALNLVNLGKPDLMLVDTHLKNMNNAGICKNLLTNIDTSTIPIIFLSSRGQDDELMSEIIARGFDTIEKPVSPDQLIQKIPQYLKKSPKKGNE